MAYIPKVRLSKPGLRAPCMYIAWDERKKKDIEAYPAVDCYYACDFCGWNPEVKKERLEKMFNGRK